MPRSRRFRVLEVSRSNKIFKSIRFIQQDYKDVQKTNNSRREITENLGVNEALGCQKSKNVRERFTKVKKRMKSRSRDTGSKSVPGYISVFRG